MKTLYKKIADANFKELRYGRHTLVGDIQALLPDIAAFTEFFLNLDFGDDTDRMQVAADVGEILHDIVQAVENDDEVLLMDATSYGLLKYMRLFLPEDEQEDSGDEDGASDNIRK